MPILTAMPSAEEFAAAPHELFEVLTPDQVYSAGQYLADARHVVEDVLTAGKTPLFVGGTGFYLKVLKEGISPIPEVSAALVTELTQEAQTNLPALYARLQGADPTLANQLKPGDTQRIVRAISVQETTGKPLSYWQEQSKEGALPLAWTHIALAPPKAVVDARIDERLQHMLAIGMVAEVTALAKRYPPNAPGLSSLGVGPFLAHIAGEISLAEAMRQYAIQQKQYAKRQLTWARNSYPADITLETPDLSKLCTIL